MKQYYYPSGIKTELIRIGNNDKFVLYSNCTRTNMYIYTVSGEYVNDCLYRDIQDLRYYGFPDSFGGHFVRN